MAQKKSRPRNYVIRPDGKPINVPRNRGQLFICENGCCCGHTERGFAPVPHDLYYTEWERRKHRNRVHLNHAGCLGPCALANVTMLIFDGRPVWFHSVNSEKLILAIFDYIDSMLEADRYLPPPPILANHVFNGFSWDGTEQHTEPEAATTTTPIADETTILTLSQSHILFLTHADTDLLALSQATVTLPDDFPQVRGRNLSSLPTAAHVDEFIRTELDKVQVIVLRSLGGRQGFSHGFDKIVEAANRHNKDLICIPGTEGLDPELTAHSTVPVPVIHDVYRYLLFGGVENMHHLLRFLADHLLAGGWGYDLPVEQPRHGIYRAQGSGGVEVLGSKRTREQGDNGSPQRPSVPAPLPISNYQTIEQWLDIHDSTRPTVGILFYRSHWLSGNTDFVDALIEEIESTGGNALPIFTTSLKETVSTGNEQLTINNEQPEIQNSKFSAKPPRGKIQNSDLEIPAAFEYLYQPDGQLIPDVLISTISFAMGGINPEGPTTAGWNVSALETLNIPILQAISSGMSREEWELSQRGLRPLDVAMNVALPEFDGRIITVPISFKGNASNHNGQNGKSAGEPFDKAQDRQGSRGTGENFSPQHPSTPAPLHKYIPLPDRVRALTKLALRHAALRHKPNVEKRIVFVLTNSPGKADRIGNAVGLDAPASLMRLFERMQADGYSIENLFEDSDTLLHELIDRCSYDETILTESQLAQAAGRVPVDAYDEWFKKLTPSQRKRMTDRWFAPPGEAYVHLDAQGRNQHIALAGLELGNIFLALQPPRGYNMDPDAIYHTPDLPPTHNYYALYKWLVAPEDEGGWGADAMVHMGKHGTLEWLPGKGIGLSEDCYPDAFLADLPLIYPFIINNPGEGAQAKRRAHAAIIDHMIPPMTSADVYGELATLTQLVDEYYQVEQMDPSKLPYVQQQIWNLMQQTNLDKDIAEMMRFVDHGDHSHEWDGSYTDDGTPLTLAEMNATDFSHLLEDIDGYLCELGSLQIRDGLHILGYIPEGDQLCNLLRSLTRIPNGAVPSLRAEVAAWIGFDLDTLLENRGGRLTSDEWQVTSVQQRWPSKTYATHADIIELVDDLCLQLLQYLEKHNFDSATIDAAIDQVLGEAVVSSQKSVVSSQKISPRTNYALRTTHHGTRNTQYATISEPLHFVCQTLVPLIRRNGEEIDNLMNALSGGYVPAGPAGAPTRGMAHILPTGRNFYAVDPQAIPSQAAWRVGQQLADELIARYQTEEGDYPESVGLSIWGTSAMRTHGDDIAQCFALLGVRPVWQAESRRVKDVEVIPLAELDRPRIDVLMRISGFFRDAFPHLVELMDLAVQKVAQLDESADQNFVRKHVLQDMANQLAAGRNDDEAERRASYRIFGSKPGSYGAGILPLINEQNWQNESDFAQAYVNWGGYAYGKNIYGDDAREEFKATLSEVQIAVKNQDNREHDIFDSDDYLQYHGGMIATIRALNGRNPKSYFGDNSNPERAEVRTLQHEAHRVFRSRVVNPKWIEGIQRHGYKGALELAATVDYLFGYDATAQVVEDWMYEQTAQTYALDPALQEFFQQSNPWALQSITERLLEAAQRGMWSEPNAETLEQLQSIYLQIDGELEGRN